MKIIKIIAPPESAHEEFSPLGSSETSELALRVAMLPTGKCKNPVDTINSIYVAEGFPPVAQNSPSYSIAKNKHSFFNHLKKPFQELKHKIHQHQEAKHKK